MAGRLTRRREDLGALRRVVKERPDAILVNVARGPVAEEPAPAITRIRPAAVATASSTTR